MALTPVEVRHIQLKRGLFGYRKAAVHRMGGPGDAGETMREFGVRS